MQTIIMTVGTSLRTNPDRDLPPDKKRPWAGTRTPNDQRAIKDVERAIAWMKKTEMELISAETHTLWRMDYGKNDEIFLLHSDTISGLECAEILQTFFQTDLGIPSVFLRKIPGVNYELEKSGLEQMIDQLNLLIDEASGIVTLAATGGFKAQTMIMGLVGNLRGVPVCYVHEAYQQLVYLPYIDYSGQAKFPSIKANLKPSTKPRSEVINVQESKKHHRPKSWKKAAKFLPEIPWVEYVRFNKNAFAAPRNGVKKSPRENNVIWIHLYENEDMNIAVSVDTTAITPEEQQLAAIELNKRISSLI